MAKLPSQKDLEKLPLRAIVAYAARNARRVQPLFQEASGIKDHNFYSLCLNANIRFTLRWVNGESVNVNNLTDSVFITSTAADAAIASGTEAAGFAANTANFASGYIIDADGIKSKAVFNACFSVECANSAAYNAGDYAKTPIFSFTSRTEKFVAIVTRTARFVIEYVDNIITSNRPAINDYQKLLSMNLSEEDAIDASENGPLGPYWPKGKEPDWYKELYPKMQALLDEPDEEIWE